MDILISSNFERLLWFIAYDVCTSSADGIQQRRQIAGLKIKECQTSLKTRGGFRVEQKVLDAETLFAMSTDGPTLAVQARRVMF